MLFKVICHWCEFKCAYKFILLVMHRCGFDFHRLLQRQRHNVLHFARQDRQDSVSFMFMSTPNGNESITLCFLWHLKQVHFVFLNIFKGFILSNAFHLLLFFFCLYEIFVADPILHDDLF